MTPPQNIYEFTVSRKDAGLRLDVFLNRNCPQLSRSQVKRLVDQGKVALDGEPTKASHLLKKNEKVRLEIPRPEPVEVRPEAIELDILFEDPYILAINKAAERVVHPGAGIRGGTLVNAILHHCTDLSGIGGKLRPGIVHRLDKGTSGLLLVAKTDRAHHDLSRQFQAREIEKTYVAFVWGKPKAATGLIDRALGRNPKNRKRISSRVRGGREAVTEYRLVKTWGAISLLELRPKTGRTHQIRVHLAEIGHSIVGDPVYGRGVKKLGDFPETIQDKLKSFPFQLLHALTLSFVHPETGERMAITAPVRKEMAEFEGELDQWINSSRT